MTSPLALVWDLIAHDNASAAFARVSKSAGAAAKETGSAGAALSKMGNVVALAGVAVAAVSVKMATDFQTSTTLLVTGAGESEKALEGVKSGILSMAGSVGTMPIELSKGMFLIESAGYHGAAGLKVLKAAAEGAKVGGADMRTVADGLTTAMKDYNIPTAKAAETTSKLIATVGQGKTTMEALSGSLGRVLPFSAALGVSFNQTMGAMAVLTTGGMAADKAATALKTAIVTLSAESGAGAKALKNIGLSGAQMTNDLKSKGLTGTLKELSDAIGKKFPHDAHGADVAMKTITGGAKGMAAVLLLTGTHTKEFADKVKTIGAASTEAGGHVKGWGIANKDLGLQMERIKAAVAAVAIEIGNRLIPAISKTIDFFTKHATVTKTLAEVIGGVMVIALAKAALGWARAGAEAVMSAAKQVAAWVATGVEALAMGAVYTAVFAVLVAGWIASAAEAVVSAAVVVASWVASGVAAMASAVAMAAAWVIALGPIALVVVAIAAVAVFIATHWNMIKAMTVAVWNAISGAISTAVSTVVNFVKSHWQLLIAIILGPLGVIVGLVISNWSKIQTVFSSGVSAVVGFFTALPGKILGALSGLGSLLIGVGSNIVQGLITGIGAMASAVGHALVGLLPGPLQKFAGLLGIHSPSTVFAEFGRNIGQGLIDGIDSSLSGVVAASGRLAGSVSMPSVSGAAGGRGATSSVPGGLSGNAAGASATAAAASGSRPINLTINPQAGQSEAQIGDAAAKQLMWAMAR